MRRPLPVLRAARQQQRPSCNGRLPQGARRNGSGRGRRCTEAAGSPWPQGNAPDGRWDPPKVRKNLLEARVVRAPPGIKPFLLASVRRPCAVRRSLMPSEMQPVARQPKHPHFASFDLLIFGQPAKARRRTQRDTHQPLEMPASAHAQGRALTSHTSPYPASHLPSPSSSNFAHEAVWRRKRHSNKAVGR